jgi:hypothetical protein
MIWLQKQILTILGAMEVSNGILLIGKPGKMVKGMVRMILWHSHHRQ